MHLIHL